MEKLNMHTLDRTADNIEKIAALFPHCVTERKNGEGELERAIDFEMLKQELSNTLISERDERYQFTWPDKKKSILSANQPIDKTLRPVRSESVNFDTTQNLYIEGDNLEVLKILQETYLNKVKMIYIDPPYNTGKDFVYEDNFSMDSDEFAEMSGQYDEEGNRLYDMRQNNESNGRFHTDWLNMMYPRLKIARDLLTEDGVIFISIDDNEVHNLRKICDEIFGAVNFVGTISNSNNPKGRSDDKFLATAHEYLLVYSKNISILNWYGFEPSIEIVRRYNKVGENGRIYREIDLRKTGENDLREDRPNLFYYFYYSEKTGEFFPSNESLELDGFVKIKPQRADSKEGNWRWGIETAKKQIDKLIPKFMPTRKVWGIMEKDYLEGRALVKPTTSWNFKDINSERGTECFINLEFDKRIFTNPKPLGTVKRCLTLSTKNSDIILDFFSGSATTAHAVMQLNAEDNGNRKFIMVQVPEKTDEKSEAFKAGYKNICEIGKERIRRAGAKIKEENPLTTQDLDCGFRVLKVDSSNTKEEIRKKPYEVTQASLFDDVNNMKDDRTPEDLLFQAMLQLRLKPSSKIVSSTIANKQVFNVEDNFLIACFDKDITDETIMQIAKEQPHYFVTQDSSMASDSVSSNFDNIFKQFSPETIRKVL